MKTLIVLPSYNESDNIIRLMDTILQISKDFFILVVDDNSPDGTSQLVEQVTKNHSESFRTHLITREKKNGRGGAVRDGFLWGLGQDLEFKNFVEITFRN